MTDGRTLRGRHALVCGASSGIGRAIALALAGKSAGVTALARRADRLEALVPELLEAGASSADFITADLDEAGSLEAAAESLLARVGAVHVLVNNSGGPKPGRLLDAEAEDLLAGFRRHVLASHYLVRRLLPGMERTGYGRIVNVVSTSVREPIPGLGVSNTIRAAMAGWAKTLSHELPPGITINNVLPGFTDTERLSSLGESVAERTDRTVDQVREGWIALIPEGRLGRPEEIAAVAAFLASPEAAYVRGQSIAADGGRLRSI